MTDTIYVNNDAAATTTGLSPMVAVVFVEVGVTFSASCTTLASQINITMLTHMAVAAMSTAGLIPANYMTIKGIVSNTCGQRLSRRRRRSLFQHSTSAFSQQNVGDGDGTATVNIAVTWPADVVASTGLTSTQADLVIANCTSPTVMSSLFTPAFMAAYEIKSIPYLTTEVQSPTRHGSIFSKKGVSISFIIYYFYNAL